MVVGRKTSAAVNPLEEKVDAEAGETGDSGSASNSASEVCSTSEESGSSVCGSRPYKRSKAGMKAR